MSSRTQSGQKRLNLSVASDQMLLELTREGVNDAFGELWSRHSGAVMAAVRSITGYEPEDLMQEAFIKVYSGIMAAGELPISFRAYVATAAQNLARDKYRKEKNASLESFDSEPDEVLTPQADFSERVIEDSTTAQAFQKLPSRQREVLWYRDVEDLPVQEIARYVGMSPNSTTVLIKRARDAFKTAWIETQLAPGRNFSEQCRETVPKLAKYSRGKLKAIENGKVELHLLDCTHCSMLAAEGNELHKKLALVLLPMLLLGGAPGYLQWIQSKTNRVPIPAHANSIPITISNVKTVPNLALAGVATAQILEHSRSGGAPRLPTTRRTSYAIAAAAAAATIIIASGASAAIYHALQNYEPTSGAVGTSKTDTAQHPSNKEPANEHSQRQNDTASSAEDFSFQGTSEGPAYSTVANAQSIALPTFGETVTNPIVEVVSPPVLPETGPSDEPPADEGEQTPPADEPPSAPTFPTPQQMVIDFVQQPFAIEVSATPGATVYVRFFLPRQSWGTLPGHPFTADSSGNVTITLADLPTEYQGQTGRLRISQTYPTAAGESSIEDAYGQMSFESFTMPVG